MQNVSTTTGTNRRPQDAAARASEAGALWDSDPDLQQRCLRADFIAGADRIANSLATRETQNHAASGESRLPGDRILANAGRFNGARMAEYERISLHAAENRVSFERAMEELGAI